MTTSVSDSHTSLIDNLSTASGTDIGKRREENQDALGVILGERIHFYIVADGMGGVQGGAVASKLAIETFAEEFEGASVVKLNCEAIKQAIQKSNQAIFNKGNEDTTLAGMGTTFVGVAITEQGMLLFNVGDSRAYRVRNSKILQLTQDHTLVSDLIRSGAITPEQAENHPVSHMLTRSLGPAGQVEPDCGAMEDGPAGGDIYLLCSDGLYNLVSDREMLRVLLDNDLEKAKDELIRIANARGGTDNITVILIKVGDEYPVDAEQFTESEEAVGFDETDTVELEIDVNGHIRNSKSGQQFSIPENEEEPVESRESPLIQEGVSLSNVQQSTQQKILSDAEVDISGERGFSMEEPKLASGQVEDEPEVLENANSGVEESAIHDTEESEVRRRLSTGMMIVGGVVAVFILMGLILSSGSSVPEATQTLASQSSPDTQITESKTTETAVSDATSASETNDSQPIEDRPSTEAVGPEQDAASLEMEKSSVPASSTVSDQGKETDRQVEPTKASEYGPANQSLELEGIEGLRGLSFREVQGIRKRKESLQKDIALLEERLEAFEVPYSGNLAEVLVNTSRERQAFEAELTDIQAKIDLATRDLATWFARQKKFNSGNRSMKLVEEVAESSEAVKEAKTDFENTTWEYLKQAEALRYSQSDLALQAKVKDLIAARKEKQADMYRLLEEEINRSIALNNEKILELNTKRDSTKEEVDRLLDELDYLKTLMSGSEEQRAKLKASLEIELLRASAALEELQRIFSD